MGKDMHKGLVTENKVIIENGEPKLSLTEDASVNGVSVDEAIRLAQQLAMKIIEKNTSRNGKDSSNYNDLTYKKLYNFKT